VGNPNIVGNASVSSPYETLTLTGNTGTGILELALKIYGSNNATFAQLGFGFQNFNWSDVQGVTVTNTGTVGSASNWGVMGSGNLDGFGSFDQTIGANSAQGNRLNAVDIQIQFKSGSYDDAVTSNFEVKNGGGGNGPFFYFASDYFPASGISGYVGDDLPPVTPTPEPASMTLCGIGGVLLVGAWWRKRRAA
jgi:hypothetical protein